MAAKKKKGDAVVFLSAADIREFGIDELRAKLVEQRQQLMTARLKHAVAQLENTSALKGLRRQVARMATLLNEKELSGL
ncbi:MAG: 50S ribosomal protein L29 [Candidatus Desulfovibrio kirbyi]|jgi:large subunit ribosomal protein L29|uniref:Large ribosomal subunit protein uL29 n=1 Tax=Candidatus Desulfovibrio kirbyi TaxID=2696086 RepID=A0A6L2R561_9BACT|nr:50S ribosomal protein L29 [Desulfovibrio sp.]GFH62643.1 MAG: 50S ribosomal protein L29 [Candidatus Desulfovibrio kirbyi]